MMNIALVHDYLNQAGGAERVVASFLDMFPGAPLYTSFYIPEALPDLFQRRKIHASFIQRLPNVREWYRYYLLLYPLAFRSFRMSGVDLVLTSSATFAQGIRIPPGVPHVVYCHTPMRFVWETDKYFKTSTFHRAQQVLLEFAKLPLKKWDYDAARRVTHYIANSRNTQRKIKKFYGRDSEVIYPPIETRRFSIAAKPEDFYLIVSRLVHQKNIQLAVEAFSRLKRPLKIIGCGPFENELRRMAGPSIEFLGYQSDKSVAGHMSRCRAFILAGEEDLGMTPLEANAAGRPVIAYGKGGALETVVDGETGVLFSRPTWEALSIAVLESEARAFHPKVLRAHALRFDEASFQERIRAFLKARGMI